MKLYGHHIRYALLACLLLLLGVLNGCATARMRFGAPPEGGRSGLYYLKQCDKNLKEALLKIKGKGRPHMFVSKQEEGALPLNITLNFVESSLPGVNSFPAYLQSNIDFRKDAEVSNLNLLLCIATLSVFPYFVSESCSLRVNLQGDPYLDKRIDVDLSRTTVYSLVWQNDKASIASKTCDALAKIIADNLTEVDYEESLGLDWELLRRKKQILRDFCLQEMPSLWRTLLDLESSMKSENDELAKFRANLLELGRNPADESLYKGLFKKHATQEKLLLSLYKKLEDVYLTSLVYERSHSEAQRRQHIQNAEQDIRLMIKKFSYKE
jgi:hypothetical protein